MVIVTKVTANHDELLFWITYFKVQKLKEFSKHNETTFLLVKKLFHTPMELEKSQIEALTTALKQLITNDQSLSSTEHEKVQLEGIRFWVNTFESLDSGNIVQTQINWDNLSTSFDKFKKLKHEVRSWKEWNAQELVVISRVFEMRFDEIRPSFIK